MVALDQKALRAVQVEHFSYRSAAVGEIFLEIPRALLGELEDALAKKAGVCPDNHTAYGLTYDGLGGENTTYIWFTDRMALFGRKITKR